MRSGSTLLSSMLDNFLNIGVTLESSLLFTILTGRPTYETKEHINEAINTLYDGSHRLYADRKFLKWDIPVNVLRDKLYVNLPFSNADFVYHILDVYFSRHKPTAKFWIYKGVDINLLESIKQSFPESKYIYIYRDGRAVYCSKKRAVNLNTGSSMASDPVTDAKIWVQNFTKVKSTFDKNYLLMVEYENLIKHTTDVLTTVYEFLSGDSDKEMDSVRCKTNYFSKIPDEQRILHPNINKKPILERIEAWKQEISFAEQYLYEKTAYGTLKMLGYPVDYYGTSLTRSQKRELFFYLITFGLLRLKKNVKKLIFYIKNSTLFFKRLRLRLGKKNIKTAE